MPHHQSRAPHAHYPIRRQPVARTLRRRRLIIRCRQAHHFRSLGRWRPSVGRHALHGPGAGDSMARLGNQHHQHDRKIQPRDFALAAEPGRATMKAAVIRPFHWHPDFYTLELPVRDGAVQRDASEAITKFAIVDRFSGDGRVSKMFWRGCGPRTPDTALACSVAHDKHNIWTVGSSDAAMAKAVNALRKIQGGWALV